MRADDFAPGSVIESAVSKKKRIVLQRDGDQINYAVPGVISLTPRWTTVYEMRRWAEN